jgi:predicted GNAT family acetyltransferase
VAPSSEPIITNQPVLGESAHTFDLTINSAKRGYLEYSLPDAGTMVIHFVEVDPALRGQGMGERLVDAAVDWARVNGRRIVPRCSYARAVLTRTAKYQDVLR